MLYFEHPGVAVGERAHARLMALIHGNTPEVAEPPVAPVSLVVGFGVFVIALAADAAVGCLLLVAGVVSLAGDILLALCQGVFHLGLAIVGWLEARRVAREQSRITLAAGTTSADHVERKQA